MENFFVFPLLNIIKNVGISFFFLARSEVKSYLCVLISKTEQVLGL